MSFELDGKPSKRADVNASVASVRDECRFMVRRMAMPIEPHETSVKAQLNKVARITGLPPRRVKDFWHNYLNAIPTHQYQTIRGAYEKWLETWEARALADLQQIEAERAHLQANAAQYSSERWNRAIAAGTRARLVGKQQADD